MARTLVTNISGEEKHFGFVPPHGVDLEDGGEKVVDGDLRTILAGGRGRYSRSREIAALDAAVEDGVVTVEDHPDPSSSSSSSS
jgi:hypothetical protein